MSKLHTISESLKADQLKERTLKLFEAIYLGYPFSVDIEPFINYTENRLLDKSTNNKCTTPEEYRAILQYVAMHNDKFPLKERPIPNLCTISGKFSLEDYLRYYWQMLERAGYLCHLQFSHKNDLRRSDLIIKTKDGRKFRYRITQEFESLDC